MTVTNAHLAEGATEVADEEFIQRGDVKAVELHVVTKVGVRRHWDRVADRADGPGRQPGTDGGGPSKVMRRRDWTHDAKHERR